MQALACGKETARLPTPVFIRQFQADLECGKSRPLSIFNDKVALLLFLEIVNFHTLSRKFNENDIFQYATRVFRSDAAAQSRIGQGRS